MRTRLFLLIQVCLFCLFWLSGCTKAADVRANDYITSRAFLEDSTGKLSIEQVVGAEFQPIGEILSKGYTDSAHWLRITVKPHTDDEPLVLRIRPTVVDEVTLYAPDPAKGTGWKKSTTGDFTPFMLRERPSVTLGFRIKPSALAVNYYLRIKSSSTTILQVMALDPHAARLEDAWLGLIEAVFLGVMLSALLWAVNDYVTSRQTVVAWFALHQCSYIFYGLAVTGHLALLFPSSPAGLDSNLTNLSACLTTLLGLIFHRCLLALFLPSRLGLHLLDVLIFTMLIALTALATGQSRLALQTNAWVMLLAAPVLTGIVFTARLSSPVLRIIYCLMVTALLFFVMSVMGWTNVVEWTLNVWMLNGSTFVGLMLMLLGMRSRQLQRESVQATLQLELTRTEVARGHQQREYQQRFMAMLSHELKTPLSVIRMALGMQAPSAVVQRHALQSVADIDAVVERCVQVDQLEQHLLTSRQQACDVGDMLASLRGASTAPQRFVMRMQVLPSIHIDFQLLQVALINLIDNAFKYADANQPIHVAACQFEHQTRPGILVSISNTPCSVGLPDANRIFEKYYRGPGAHGKTGSGLGLYLVRGSIEQLGGWVRYSPSLNEVRFELWIPS